MKLIERVGLLASRAEPRDAIPMRTRFVCIVAVANSLAAFSVSGAEAPLDYAGAEAAAISCSDDLQEGYELAALRRGAWKLGYRAYLPTVSIALGEDDRVAIDSGDSFSKSAGATVKQTIWDGGRLGASREFEAADIEAVGYELSRKARALGEAAITAYRSILVLRGTAEIRKAVAENLRAQRQIMDVEAVSGLIRKDELIEADLEVENADIEFRASELAVSEAEDALARMIGKRTLPPLVESIATDRVAVDLDLKRVVDKARSRNPDLTAARFAVAKKKAETRASSFWGTPTVSVTGSFRVGGNEYPLTRSAWNVGLCLDFSGPWSSLSSAFNAGKEPPFVRTAASSLRVEPFPDPASSATQRQVKTALEYASRKYSKAAASIESTAASSAERYRLAARKLALARASSVAERKKYELILLRAKLGSARRVDVMEANIEFSKKAIAELEAAAEFLAREREIENLMDLPPGSLIAFSRRREPAEK